MHPGRWCDTTQIGRIARPLRVECVLRDLRENRVQVNIPTQLGQIAVRIDENGLEAAPNEWAIRPALAIVALRVDPVEMAQRATQMAAGVCSSR